MVTVVCRYYRLRVMAKTYKQGYGARELRLKGVAVSYEL